MANKSGTTIALVLTSVILLGTGFYFVARAGRRKGEMQGGLPEDEKKKRKSTVSVGELESLGYGDKVNLPTSTPRAGNMNIFETLMSKLSFKPTTSTYGVDPDRLKAINQKAVQMGMGSATRQPYRLNTELGIKGL